MDVITTHLNADFDTIASMLAACKLYPGAVCVLPGSQEETVKGSSSSPPSTTCRCASPARSTSTR